MARTNQGVFRATLNRYDELITRYEYIMTHNYDELDFLDFLVDCGELYDDIDEFKHELNGTLKTVKFELDCNSNKYENMTNELQSAQSEIERRFREVKSSVEYTGGFSDVEIDTLDRYSLWRR